MSPHPEPEDLHAILGVSTTATPEEIKAAYRTRAKSLHPDLNPDADTTAEFQRVQKAYAALTNPRSRHRQEVPAKAPAAPKPPPRPRATRSVTRPLRAYGLAAAVLVMTGAGAFWVLTHTTPPVRPETAFEHTMESAVSRQASELFVGPPEPATVEVAGRDGRTHLLSRASYQRIEALLERLNTERTSLERRRADLGRRKGILEGQLRAFQQSPGSRGFELQLKAEAYTRDAQALVRDAENHFKEFDRYFAELERLEKEEG